MAKISTYQMLSSFILLSVYFVCIVLSAIPEEYGNCPELTLQDLGTRNLTNEGLIPQATEQSVPIIRHQIFCLSSSTVEGTFRSASAVVQYIVELFVMVRMDAQFAFVCDVNDEWVLSPVNPSPNFAIEVTFDELARNDCSFCSPVPPASNAVSYDSITYCIGKLECCALTRTSIVIHFKTSDEYWCKQRWKWMIIMISLATPI